MEDIQNYQFWFITGSQFLYGPETLAQVEKDSRTIVDKLNESGNLPCPVIYKDIMKTSQEITKTVKEANYDDFCAGIITFMHTFSPSKMWIAGLDSLQKPYLHFHTQFNRQIPNEKIDMDYMNLHQSAHGDREHGFIGARLRISRKIVVGYWQDENVQIKIGDWMRAAIGVAVSKSLKVMRFGDNMREVAVTEGDKVEAQKRLGWEVNTWPVGLLAEYIEAVAETDVDVLIKEYEEKYIINTDNVEAIRYQAKEEIAMERLLEEKGCGAFSNTFENLYGLKQLPGLASQRLMEKGYGYGGEGDWKVSAMTRIMKAMSFGKTGGTAFMEDYTYDLTPGKELSLGAHMLEVCPSIAADTPKIEVHELGIGNREAPARLVFDGHPGKAIVVTLIDIGGRLRMIVQDIECVTPIMDMPKLPVAKVMWRPEPDLVTGAEAWLLAGGAHHTVLSYDLTAEHMRDFSRMLDVEFVHINKDTDPVQLEKELLFADLCWKLNKSI